MSVILGIDPHTVSYGTRSDGAPVVLISVEPDLAIESGLPIATAKSVSTVAFLGGCQLPANVTLVVLDGSNVGFLLAAPAWDRTYGGTADPGPVHAAAAVEFKVNGVLVSIGATSATTTRLSMTSQSGSRAMWITTRASQRRTGQPQNRTSRSGRAQFNGAERGRSTAFHWPM